MITKDKNVLMFKQILAPSSNQKKYVENSDETCMLTLQLLRVNPFTPSQSVMETPKVILTSESVNEILWCDHSNETSLAVLSLGSIHNLGFYKNEIWDWSWILILGTLGSERVNPYPEGPRVILCLCKTIVMFLLYNLHELSHFTCEERKFVKSEILLCKLRSHVTKLRSPIDLTYVYTK